jgi:hypothetical protein
MALSSVGDEPGRKVCVVQQRGTRMHAGQEQGGSHEVRDLPETALVLKASDLATASDGLMLSYRCVESHRGCWEDGGRCVV